MQSIFNDFNCCAWIRKNFNSIIVSLGWKPFWCTGYLLKSTTDAFHRNTKIWSEVSALESTSRKYFRIRVQIVFSKTEKFVL